MINYTYFCKCRSQDLKEENNFLKNQLRIIKKEMEVSNEGLLLLEKNSLEETLNQLTLEVFILVRFKNDDECFQVEFLSMKNDKMLKELKQKDFYESYNKIVAEVFLFFNYFWSFFYKDGETKKRI